jgi:hypothetical protein
MDDLLREIFTPTQVTKVNLCHLFLQVESLAKISNTTDHRILGRVWRGERPPSSSKFLWPHQACPHEASWQLWRRFLRLIYLGPSQYAANKRSTDLCLDTPLGAWIGQRHFETYGDGGHMSLQMEGGSTTIAMTNYTALTAALHAQGMLADLKERPFKSPTSQLIPSQLPCFSP